MTSSCRDNAGRFLKPFRERTASSSRGSASSSSAPEMDLVAAALDEIAAFHDYHHQPRQATKYRAEATALRKCMAKVTA